ncbi:MAG: alpha-2-macroglobulin family protein [Deltaproteobacteria bacterium]|jgi:uncharacterized protein YfaS (alpha-2-macroglobulin family)|nr:alpha-2-macroglobulin family protein [Deltaproteobacteria bacterium]
MNPEDNNTPDQENENGASSSRDSQEETGGKAAGEPGGGKHWKLSEFHAGKAFKEGMGAITADVNRKADELSSKLPSFIPGPLRNVKILAGLALLILLGLVVTALALSGDKEKDVKITDDQPANMLLRDDSVENGDPSSKGDNMGNRNEVKPLDPKLFVKLGYDGAIYAKEGGRFADFTLTLSIDEAACKKYYGNKEGLVLCRNNWDFLQPDDKGWKSSPSFDSPWETRRDTYSYSAKTTITLEQFPTDAKFRMSAPARLGDNVVIEKPYYEFTSRDYTLELSSFQFLVDPQNPRNIMLSATVSAYPFTIDPAQLEKNLSITLPPAKEKEERISITSSKSTVKVDKVEITCNDDKTRAYVSARVTGLPPVTTAVQLRVEKGVKRPGGKGETPKVVTLGTNVVGQDTFVSLDNMDNTIVTSDDQDKKQVLMLAFTRKLEAAAVQKSVKAVLLPYSRPGEDTKHKRRTDWSDIPPDQITAEDLAAAQPVDLKPDAALEEMTGAVSFTYGATGGRYMYIACPGGAVPSETDYKLHEFAEIRQVPGIDPELRIMQEGTILSMGGARKLAIMSRGLDEIMVTAHRVRPEYLNLLVTQATQRGLASTDFASSGDYYYYDESGNLEFEDVSEVFRNIYKTTVSNGYQPDYSSVDLTPFLEKGGKGIFYLKLSGYLNDNHKVSDTRFLLVTDLGITAKQGASGERDVFVSSFAKGGPVREARVQVLGRNGLPVFSMYTNSLGRVALPELSGFTDEKKPVAITVAKGNDFAYLPLNDSTRSLSMSHFPETAGRAINKDGVSVFSFSERGIFRPGENLRFGLIAKPGSWDAGEMAGLPLKARLLDPRGNKVYENAFKLDTQGMYDLDIPMDENYPTGRYNLDIYLSNSLIGSANVQVEEFQPDNLKVRASFVEIPAVVKGWVKPANLVGQVKVENLYGTAAVGNRVEASYSLSPTRLSFNKFKGYSFYDPGNWGSSYSNRLSSDETDENGEATFVIPADRLSGGTYWLTFEAEAFEQGGGRSVSASARLLVSPLEALVGWTSEAKLDFLASDSEAKVSFIAIDNNLERIGLDDLSLNISEVTYVASLIRDSSGRYRYDNVRKLIGVRDEKVSVDAARGLEITLPTDKTGEFVLTLKDGQDVTRSNLSYVVAGGAQRRFGLERDAALRVHLDKREYNAGDEMRIFVSAPYAGSGLITIESDRVYAHKWFRADTSDSVQTLTVPANFEGRAFVSVSLVRNINSDAVHSTPHTYAVAPFVANIAKRNMYLKLEAPELVQPGDVLSMKVSAQKPGKAVVWAVSEGILQLTSYKTPSPMDYFLRQNPLMVATMQNLDLIMPEFYLMNRSAFGGDFAADMLVARAAPEQLNPFKRKAEPSVVYWSGVLDVGPQGVNLEWEVPAYFNGTLRLMAVSASDQAVGETSRKTTVRGPLIITPDLPVAVAPGDEFEVTAAIANNIEDSGQGLTVNVKVELDDTGGLSFMRQPEPALSIDEGREGKAVFRLKANAVLGEARVNFVASARRLDGSEVVVKRPITLSVRPASPRMTSFKAGFVKSDNQVVPVGRSMYAEYANVEASLSGLPLPLVDALSTYLVNYPYGCTEQILSKAFPYAVLHESPELAPIPRGETAAQARRKAVDAVNRGILTLRERQVQPGRFTLWPREYHPYSFLTVYAFDFLLSAREAGFEVPDDLFNNTRNEVAAILQNLPNDRESARIVCYAAWVYTRSGQRFTGLPELVKHLDGNLKDWRKSACGALIAACYKMLQQNDEADKLIAEVRPVPQKADEYTWSYGSWFYSRLWDNGMQLNVYSRYFPAQLGTSRVNNLLVNCVNDVVDNSYTSPGSSQAIRGLVGFALGNMKKQDGLELIARDAQHQNLALEAVGEAVKRLAAGNEAAEFMFSGGKDLYWQISTDGFDKEPPAAKARKLNISARYIPAGGKDLEDLAQGDEVYVLITASAQEAVDNIAITSLIPGGFEMVISKGGQIVGGGASGPAGEDYDDDDEGDDEGDSDWTSGLTRAYPNEAHRQDVYRMLSEAGLKGTPMSLVHVERREDRMVAYTSLGRYDTVFVYSIKAINKGKYTLPTVFAEALYDPDARANTNPGKIEVK